MLLCFRVALELVVECGFMDENGGVFADLDETGTGAAIIRIGDLEAIGKVSAIEIIDYEVAGMLIYMYIRTEVPTS